MKMNKKMNKNKLEQFEKLSEEYLEKVAKEYDKRNKGSYFHYDRIINKDNKGIEWNDGGKELSDHGRNLISKAMLLYLPEFQKLYHKINELCESNDFIKIHLDDTITDIGFLTFSL